MARRSAIRGNPGDPDDPADPASPAGPDFSAETALHAAGSRRVAGVDEAGRGPLAGPVCVAAVVLDPAAIPEGLNDSKLIAEDLRETLYEQILASADVAIATASAATIDRINIRAATLAAMRRAVMALGQAADHALIDGRDVPDGLGVAATALIGGDRRSLSIAAASIVAKVSRDRLMRRCDALYPDYGLGGHKGYATAAHRAAIALHGPCPIHRTSFAPLSGAQDELPLDRPVSSSAS